MSLVGGARINPQGDFEISVGKGQQQAHMHLGPLKTYVKDYFDFLTSPDPSRQIGGSMVLKTLSRSGMPMVSFGFLEPDFRVSLFLKQPGYAVFVLELPFPVGALDLNAEDEPEAVEVDASGEEAY